jgi:murein DD-endopeptidase MepM/ murein hydrolase activator NlpD
MAVIDSKKLLPPSKSTGSALTTQKFLVPISNIKVKSSAIVGASDITPVENERVGGGKTLLGEFIQIRKNFVSIQKIIGDNNTLFKKGEEGKRKLLEKEKFAKKEKQLEKKDPKQKISLSIPSLPRTGFLDAIKRFLFYTLLGATFVKFGKYIPKILEFSKKLAPAFKFVEDFAGNVLNGVVDFVGAGYKTYDKVRELTKQVGGEDFQKKFDEFSRQFNTFANLALIAGMSTMSGTDFSGGGKPDTTKPGFDRVKGGKVSKPTQARYLSRYGKNAFTNRFGQQSLRSLTGKGAGKVAGKILGKVPIIGGLIDFIISTIIFKEKPGRAAAKAVGSTIGAALGTFIPVPFAGTILGGVVGDLVGGSLYDSLVGNDTLKAKAQGGQVTRGGQRVSGPVRRSVRRVRTRPPKIKPQKTIPGKDIGGKEEIKKIFPSPANPNQRNPLGVLETTSKNLKEIPLLGGIMGASVDLAMGQKPDVSVFRRIGYGFGALVQNAIDAETSNTIGNIQKEIVGLAGGGAVPRTLSTGESIGMKIGERLGKTLEAMMNSKVTETLQSIRQQFSKEGFGLGPDEGTGGGPGVGGGEIPGDAPPEVKAMLDAISAGEGSWDSVNPGTTVPGLSNMTISDARKAAMRKGYSMGGSGAMGKWQQMPEFILNRAKSAGLNPDVDKFTPENQTKIARMLMSSVYPGGEQQLVKDAQRDPMYAASKLRGTWPSLPGGSQANTTEKQFRENFAKSLQTYKTPSSVPTKGSFASVLPRGNPQFTSGFGSRWGREHRGIDIGVDANSPVTSLGDGKVVAIYENYGGNGVGIVVQHTDGTKIVYGHVNRASGIRVGSSVRKGQIIATVKGWYNAYGNKDNTHLHLERHVGGVAQDPTGYLNSITPKPKKDNRQASLAPSTSPSIASGLNQKTSYEIAGGPTIMLQKVIIEKPVPMPMSGGPIASIDNSRTTSSTAALSIG